MVGVLCEPLPQWGPVRAAVGTNASPVTQAFLPLPHGAGGEAVCLAAPQRWGRFTWSRLAWALPFAWAAGSTGL